LRYSPKQWAIIVAALSVPALFLAFTFAPWDLYQPHVPFEAKRWLEPRPTDKSYPRLGMADDLIRKNTLKGLTRQQVIDLLGEPGNHKYFQEYDLVYWLGLERGFMAIDSEWLAIRIDKASGKVISYQLVRD
jgi:hypothetical protein